MRATACGGSTLSILGLADASAAIIVNQVTDKFIVEVNSEGFRHGLSFLCRSRGQRYHSQKAAGFSDFTK
jgi:hypothetical protein